MAVLVRYIDNKTRVMSITWYFHPELLLLGDSVLSVIGFCVVLEIGAVEGRPYK